VTAFETVASRRSPSWRDVFERIERLNPTLHAFITVTPEVARRQARAAEAELTAGR
jgi:Asp-tRNA(Asn)/Glu-tRNA(Gln) amidotransferase A subunit family amidase